MGHVRNYTIGDVISMEENYKVLMFCTQWGGMHLGCQLKMQLWKKMYTPGEWTYSNISTDDA